MGLLLAQIHNFGCCASCGISSNDFTFSSTGIHSLVFAAEETIRREADSVFVCLLTYLSKSRILMVPSVGRESFLQFLIIFHYFDFAIFTFFSIFFTFFLRFCVIICIVFLCRKTAKPWQNCHCEQIRCTNLASVVDRPSVQVRPHGGRSCRWVRYLVCRHFRDVYTIKGDIHLRGYHLRYLDSSVLKIEHSQDKKSEPEKASKILQYHFFIANHRHKTFTKIIISVFI